MRKSNGEAGGFLNVMVVSVLITDLSRTAAPLSKPVINPASSWNQVLGVNAMLLRDIENVCRQDRSRKEQFE